MYNLDPYNVFLAIASNIPCDLRLCGPGSHIILYLNVTPSSGTFFELDILQNDCLASLILFTFYYILTPFIQQPGFILVCNDHFLGCNL